MLCHLANVIYSPHFLHGLMEFEEPYDASDDLPEATAAIDNILEYIAVAVRQRSADRSTSMQTCRSCKTGERRSTQY